MNKCIIQRDIEAVNFFSKVLEANVIDKDSKLFRQLSAITSTYSYRKRYRNARYKRKILNEINQKQLEYNNE